MKLVTLLALFLIFFFTGAAVSAGQSGVIAGAVRDSASGKPMRFVTVRTAGLPTGVMTNAAGGYALKLPAGSYRLLFSMVGYRSLTQEITLRAGDSLRLDAALAEAPFTAGEVVVTAEDPAVRLMRLAIARKVRQRDSLRTYSYTLYTKFAASTDTATAKRADSRADTTIFSILESYSKGYFARPDKFFNEIIQRRQTANFPPQANFVAFGTNLNCYDDEVAILGEAISSPFHPDALDFYAFAIEGETESGGQTYVRLRATPKTSMRRLFEGTIIMNKDRLYPEAVDLRPNATVRLPFEAVLRFRQHFEEIEGKYVLPTGMNIESTLKAALLYVVEPRLDIDIETVAYDYVCNRPIDDDLFAQRRIEIAPAADVFDTTFWREKSILPLRPEETAAYAAIQTERDNPDSLESRGIFDNPLADLSREIAKLTRRPFSGAEDIFRYNRVQGAYLGVGFIHEPDTALELRAGAGYGTADKRWYGWGGATVFFDKLHRYSLGASAYRRLARRDLNSAVGISSITLLSLLFKNDYADYYYADGYEVSAEAGFGQLRFVRQDVFVRPTSFRLFFRSEEHNPAGVNARFAVFGGGREFRQNPAAIPGILRSFGGAVNWNFSPLRRIGGNGVRLEAEVSEPTVFPTDFSFRQAQLTAFLRTRTLPLWRLDAKFSAGWSEGSVPPQRFFSMESAASSTAAEGAIRGLGVKEFYGDRYAALTFEHNFGEVVPGLFRIPNLASFGLEFILTGAVGYTAFSQRTLDYTATLLPATAGTRETVYYEAGLGVNRALLLFRFDITARISQRTSPQFYFTVSAATF